MPLKKFVFVQTCAAAATSQCNFMFTPKSYTFYCEWLTVNVTFAVNRHRKTEHPWQAIVSRSYLPESEHFLSTVT